MSCEHCNLIRSTLTEIYHAIEELPEKESFQYDYENCQYSINKWKAHILKTVVQAKAKSDIINNISNDSVYIIMDWAMKFLPQLYHETQSEFFGKRGIPWHVMVSFFKVSDYLEVSTFIHCAEGTKQDWIAFEEGA